MFSLTFYMYSVHVRSIWQPLRLSDFKILTAIHGEKRHCEMLGNLIKIQFISFYSVLAAAYTAEGKGTG